MIWVAIAAILIALFIVGNIRVWKTERIRLKCLELSSMHRSGYIGDTEISVVRRAEMLEKYVRGAVREPQPAQPPSDP